MVHIGNHIKMNVAQALRARAREFYANVLGCKVLESPRSDLDLYEFADGVVLGLFVVEETETLAAADYLKSTWLEIKVADPATWKTRLQDFGVQEVDFPDPTRFYFQAPGGQVFRLAPMDGGL